MLPVPSTVPSIQQLFGGRMMNVVGLIGVTACTNIVTTSTDVPGTY